MELNRTDDWHLHLTVQPRNPEVARGFASMCASVDWKATIIENVPGGASGGLVRPEQELIPTMKLRGELGQAMILLHDVGKLMAMSGFIVSRMKIEGRDDSSDSLYAESHVELTDAHVRDFVSPAPLSRSITGGKVYATLRSVDGRPQAVEALRGRLSARGLIGAKLEFAVYDSNRSSDGPWFRSWGMTP